MNVINNAYTALQGVSENCKSNTKRFFEKTDPAITPKPDTLEDGEGENAIKIEDLFKDKEEK